MPTLHKRVESRFLRLVAAALFLAFSAWTGAFLLGRLPRAAEKPPEGAAAEGLRLQGIAVRRELVWDAVPALEDGRRLPAAATDGRGAGVCFAACDGYESLSPGALEALTPAGLRELLNGDAPKPPEGGKLVKGWAWYYAALAEAVGEAPAPGRCRLLFDGFSDSLPARLIRVQEQDGLRLLLFRLTAGGEALRLRKTDALLLVSA